MSSWSGMMMRRLRVLAHFWVVLLAGCLPLSIHPVSDENTSATPETLLGRWYLVQTEDGEWDEMLIRPKPMAQNTLQLGTEGDWVDGFVIEIGEAYYLSVHESQFYPDRENSGYYIVKIRPDDGDSRFTS